MLIRLWALPEGEGETVGREAKNVSPSDRSVFFKVVMQRFELSDEDQLEPMLLYVTLLTRY